MSERLSQEQVQLLLPEESRHPVRYGMSLELAVRLPGVCWAENALRAGYLPTMEGLDVLLKGQLLANRAHLAEHEDTFCPSNWAECMDVVPQYGVWRRILERESRLHLLAARSLT